MFIQFHQNQSSHLGGVHGHIDKHLWFIIRIIINTCGIAPSAAITHQIHHVHKKMAAYIFFND